MIQKKKLKNWKKKIVLNKKAVVNGLPNTKKVLIVKDQEDLAKDNIVNMVEDENPKNQINQINQINQKNQKNQRNSVNQKNDKNFEIILKKLNPFFLIHTDVFIANKSNDLSITFSTILISASDIKTNLDSNIE